MMTGVAMLLSATLSVSVHGQAIGVNQGDFGKAMAAVEAVEAVP